MSGPVVNEEARSRYELIVDGSTAFAEYELDGDRIVFTHTLVPSELGGRGIGGQLIEAALADVRKRGLKVVPLCPFVKSYMEKHPETQDLLAN